MMKAFINSLKPKGTAVELNTRRSFTFIIRLFPRFLLKETLLCSIVLLFSCFNPFFPPTDAPPGVNSLRSTPQGVILQLVKAYQQKDIDLYRDLFSTSHDFRFYVQPDYTYSNVASACEQVDTMCSYIKNKGLNCMYYWTFDKELQSHQKLFERAEQINLTCSSINDGDIRCIVNGQHETTNVEVILSGGYLEISEKIMIDKNGYPYQNNYTLEFNVQVFYLERDPQTPGLWVIWKWFDLNTRQ